MQPLSVASMAQIPACRPPCVPNCPPQLFSVLLFSSYFLLFCPFPICATIIICTPTKTDPTKRPLTDWPRRLRAVRVCASADPVHDLRFSEDALSGVKRCLGFGLLKTDGKQRKFPDFVLFCVRAGHPALGTAHARWRLKDRTTNISLGVFEISSHIAQVTHNPRASAFWVLWL